MARGNGGPPIRFSVSRRAATFLRSPAIANSMLRIETDVLIPGRGDPIQNGALVVDGPTIAYAGPIEGAPSAAGATVLNVPALMPGMWDVHGHFMGIRTLNVEEIARTPPAVLAARATKDVEVAVSAGGAGGPGRRRPLPRQARHHGRAPRRMPDDRARHVPRRGSGGPHAGARCDPRSHAVHHRPPGPSGQRGGDCRVCVPEGRRD